MLYRIEIASRPDLDDVQGKGAARAMKNFLGLDAGEVRQLKIFTVDGLEEAEVARLVDEAIWHDPILQTASLKPLPDLEPRPDWYLEVGFRPGVTDNEARTARDTAAMVLGKNRESVRVYTAVQYRFAGRGTTLSRADVDTIASGLLCNELIQRYRVKSAEEWAGEPGFEPQAAMVTGESRSDVETIGLDAMDDAALMELSRANTWRSISLR